MKQGSTPRLSVLNIFLDCLTFVRRNLVEILRRIWLLAIIGCTIFYFLFSEYMTELDGFLVAPSQARASVVLGLVSVSILLLLFVYTLAVAAVTDLALGHYRQRGIFYVRIGYQEFRLYASSLRLLLLMAGLIAVSSFIVLGITTMRLGYVAQYAVEVAAGAVLVVIALRLGFLLPAVAMAETRGVVIRKSWQLSDGIFPQLFFFAIAVILPGLLTESLGEFITRATRQFPVLYANSSLQDNISAIRHVVPVFSLLVCLPVMLTTLLHAIASAIIYRAVTGTSLSPD